MIDVSDILIRAEEAFAEFDAAKDRLDMAQIRVNNLCREFSLATGTYAFKDWMLRKELHYWQGKRHA